MPSPRCPGRTRMHQTDHTSRSSMWGILRLRAKLVWARGWTAAHPTTLVAVVRDHPRRRILPQELLHQLPALSTAQLQILFGGDAVAQAPAHGRVRPLGSDHRFHVLELCRRTDLNCHAAESFRSLSRSSASGDAAVPRGGGSGTSGSRSGPAAAQSRRRPRAGHPGRPAGRAAPRRRSRAPGTSVEVTLAVTVAGSAPKLWARTSVDPAQLQRCSRTLAAAMPDQLKLAPAQLGAFPVALDERGNEVPE